MKNKITALLAACIFSALVLAPSLFVYAYVTVKSSDSVNVFSAEDFTGEQTQATTSTGAAKTTLPSTTAAAETLQTTALTTTAEPETKTETKTKTTAVEKTAVAAQSGESGEKRNLSSSSPPTGK
ncbi:MAG: hypothetical protein LUH82_02910 [Clostridiales bacterium]|nr:hypothetical protein [Clostridiales bacterium]